MLTLCTLCFVRSELDARILPTIIACDTLTPELQRESRRVNQPTTSLRQTHARVNGASHVVVDRRPVVSLSHARTSCRVNRPKAKVLTVNFCFKIKA